MRPDGSAPDPKTLTADSDACASFAPALDGAAGGAAFAFEGSIKAGASTPDAGAALIGGVVLAGVGAVLGFLWGTGVAVSGAGHEDCMIDKGYYHT